MGESNFCWLYTFAFYIPHCIPNFPSPKAITAVKSLGSARAMELFKDLEEPWLVVPLEPGLAGQDLLHFFGDPPQVKVEQVNMHSGSYISLNQAQQILVNAILGLTFEDVPSF